MDNKIIAVDFDGTIVRNKFPEIGRANNFVIERLKEEKENGAIIILWTCREGEFLRRAVEFCEEYGVPIDYVNENADELDFETSNKIYADEYWDDRAKLFRQRPRSTIRALRDRITEIHPNRGRVMDR